MAEIEVKARPFNLPHPEAHEGEVWIANLPPNQIDTIRWQSKRVGRVAYDIEGNVIPNVFPVFAKAFELRLVGAKWSYPHIQRG